MYNTESCQLPSEEKLIEKSVKHFCSNNDTQTLVSQRYHPNTVECKSLILSINKLENNHLVASTIEEAETGQIEKYKNDRTVSNINETSQDNSKIYVNRFPGWLCFTFGAALHVALAIFKNRFHDLYTNKWAELNWRKRLPYYMLRILYTYTFGVACITHWRGGWIIIDNYLFMHVWITTALMCSLLACLAVLRCIRNLIATPFIIFIDVPHYVFRFPTRYNVNTRDWSLYLLDCAFSVGVVGTLVIFVWRGFWILIDIYLFPENPKCSAVGSLAIGYFIVAVTFCLQPLMRYVCARLQGLVLLVVADAFLLLSFLGTVNVWRGIWNALDLWLLPDNPELSCWITHISCFVFLVLLNCSNTILVRGVYIDAEEEAGKCVVFPCHYLRLFFKIKREKKQARQQKLLVTSQDFDDRTDVNEKDSENGTFLPNNTAVTIIPANADSLA
ncbi:uncharacterized protein [Anoplolepis gracilipes]|uniref:uncharacterized protein isoform X2 n=1 Tax=Anoplolepis gracilipes TaxID=354296 RepID=UPI003BA2FD8A